MEIIYYLNLHLMARMKNVRISSQLARLLKDKEFQKEYWLIIYHFVANVLSKPKTNPTYRTMFTKAIHKEAQYLCQQYNYKVGTKKGLKYHVESKHLRICYSCDQCNLMAKHRGSLKVHVESIHDGVCYPCPKCEYKATEKGSLRKHFKSRHENNVFFLNEGRRINIYSVIQF